MNLNFELILLIATLLTGAIWLADALYFAKRRPPQIAEAPPGDSLTGTAPKEPFLVEFSRFLFPVVLIVLLLRGFIAEPFKIPSGSMLPTLEVGDFILVNKFSYGLRLPAFHNRLLDLGSPQRGDVMVFRYPENPRIDYIKRVIGVPGDEIGYYNKVLHINGKPASQEYLGGYVEDYPHLGRFQESLDGKEHDILINVRYPASDFVLTVPPGRYFVMGDNRDNSKDSRAWGFVPEQNLVGKAFFIWMNWDCSFAALKRWDCNMPVWHRIGSSIQ
jgi:signal peptidase I